MNGAGASSELLSLPPLHAASPTTAAATKPEVSNRWHQPISFVAAIALSSVHTICEKNPAGGLSAGVCDTTHRLLILLPRWRGAFRERPHTVGEFQREEPVVLTSCLQARRCGIEPHLR